MNDLFRYLMLRPAEALAPGQSDPLAHATIVKNAVAASDTPAAAMQAARSFAATDALVSNPDTLHFATVAAAVATALAAGNQTAQSMVALVNKLTDRSLESLVGDERFATDRQRLADTLVSMKLLSSSLSLDAPALVDLEGGYDALERAANGATTLARIPLTIPDTLLRRATAAATPPAAPAAAPSSAPAQTTRSSEIDDAITALRGLTANDFAVPTAAPRLVENAAEMRQANTVTSPREATERSRPAHAMASLQRSPAAQPWRLSGTAMERLPAPVMHTLSSLDIHPDNTSLPTMLAVLHDAKSSGLLDKYDSVVNLISKIGTSFTPADNNGLVGTPTAGMPVGHGQVRPIGIGDLLVVRQHVLRYEGGDLAHIENVLRTEKLTRETRRLEHDEQTFSTQTETTKEEERDTQTTERFSLKRETSDTIKTDSEFKAGVSVDAKYGPFIEVKANADYSTKSSTESSAKQATEFSKDVVARSVSKISEKITEKRSTTSIQEFEEKYAHGFDNTAGTEHVSGVYQWVDKVLQAQVYNYGKRLLFDLTLPEPATAYMVAQTRDAAEGSQLVKPAPFVTPAQEITAKNYQQLALAYEVTGLEPPPPPLKMVSKTWDGSSATAPHETTKSEILAIDDGYAAKYVYVQISALTFPGASWQLLVGVNWIDAFDPTGTFNMYGETGSVPVSMVASQTEAFAANIEVFCEVTPRAMAVWQLKTHAAITQAYIAQRTAYERALAEAQAAAGVVIQGRNPMFNQRIIETELRKQALTLVTAQQFDAFGALELSADGYPQPNLARSAAQAPYVRFFEQAFEWDHLMYFFYPYFWGLKKAWGKRALLDDIDPLFSDFLRAGAARVVFPVRPGFEAAVVHYLETGELWNGVPGDINSSTYLPIVTEIQESQNASQREVPVGDPWLVHLPTTLVHLRPNDDLPKWKKVGDDWQPDE